MDQYLRCWCLFSYTNKATGSRSVCCTLFPYKIYITFSLFASSKCQIVNNIWLYSFCDLSQNLVNTNHSIVQMLSCNPTTTEHDSNPLTMSFHYLDISILSLLNLIEDRSNSIIKGCFVALIMWKDSNSYSYTKFENLRTLLKV